MELLKKLLAAGAVRNPPLELVEELAALGLLDTPTPSPSTELAAILLTEPLRDSEFAATARHIIPPLVTYTRASSTLAHQVFLWRSGLLPSQDLAKAYDTFRSEVSP